MTRHALHCTRCDSRAELEPAVLVEGLPAQRCPACRSMLLGLDDWRHWRDRRAGAHTPSGGDESELQEPARAVACPACQRIMSRHRTGTTPDFRIDRCSPCQLVWLDDGEWQVLERDALTTRLDEILTDAWQLRVRNAEVQALREQDIRRRLGDASYDEAMRVRDWLAEQPNRNELLALISSER